jgi:menaquinone-dependent protoporphyrinogen IX oxidase
METLVIYYSYTGNTRRIARQVAEELGAESFEIKDVAKPGKFKAYTWGCYKALRMQKMPAQPIGVNLGLYDKIIILAPVWAGHPAPQILSVFDLLPSGKEISFHAVSATGKSGGKDKVLLALAQKGCKAIEYQDIKA